MQTAHGFEVCSLIGNLASADPEIRAEARQALAAQGKAAVAGLESALADAATQVRYEAAGALAEIADPASAPALVRALEDPDQGVRWLAAEALIRIGRPGLSHLLKALLERADSAPFRQGAHHVVHDLSSEDRLSFLRPVHLALDEAAAAKVRAQAQALLAGPLAGKN